MSSALDNILGSLPTDQIAQRLGISSDAAQPIISEAVETLLGGLNANSKDKAGAASLAEALTQHSGDLLDGGVNLADVNEEDGKSIVSNIFGDNTDSVIATLGSKGAAGDSSLVSQLLPMLSPIVMSYLAKQVLGGGKGNSAQGNSAGGIGDLLGSLLGSGGSNSKSSGGGIGDLLGGILGGGGKSGGGLGDLLGGLLGGGKR